MDQSEQPNRRAYRPMQWARKVHDITPHQGVREIERRRARIDAGKLGISKNNYQPKRPNDVWDKKRRRWIVAEPIEQRYRASVTFDAGDGRTFDAEPLVIDDDLPAGNWITALPTMPEDEAAS